MASQKIEKNLGRKGVDEGSLEVQEEEEEEEPRLLEACQNPMLIDVILSNLFEFLHFEDLGKCRRVSKQWFQVSLPVWLTKAPEIKLYLNPNLKQEEYQRQGVNPTNMNDFLQLAHNELHSYGPYEFVGLRQYKKFNVVGEEVTDPVQHFYLQQFLRLYGQFVTELVLDLEIPDFETYQAALLSTMTPNLVKLNITACAKENDLDVIGSWTYELVQEDHIKLTSLRIGDFGNDRDYLSRLPVAGWIQLLKRYPNLKTLIYDDADVEAERGATQKMLEAVVNIRQSDRKSLDLRCLEISLANSGRVLPSILPLFRNAQFSLESLGMTFERHPPLDTAFELLNSQATTLKKLKISKWYPMGHFKAPELPFLQSLELNGHPILNFTPLNRFQTLKSLYVTYYPFEERSLPLMLKGIRKAVSLPTLTKLHADYGRAEMIRDPLGPKDVGKLVRLFPNLQDLQLWLTNDSLHAIFQNCSSGLQRLTIIGNDVDDEGISRVAHQFPKMQDLKSLSIRQCKNGNISNYVGPTTALTEKSLIKFLELTNLERLEVSLDADALDVDCEIIRKVKESIKIFKLTRASARKLDRNEEVSDSDLDDDEDSQVSRSSSSSSGGDDDDNRVDDSDEDDTSDGGNNTDDDGSDNGMQE